MYTLEFPDRFEAKTFNDYAGRKDSQQISFLRTYHEWIRLSPRQTNLEVNNAAKLLCTKLLMTAEQIAMIFEK